MKFTWTYDTPGGRYDQFSRWPPAQQAMTAAFPIQGAYGHVVPNFSWNLAP